MKRLLHLSRLRHFCAQGHEYRELANMQFVSDPLRRGAEGAEQTPRRSRCDALQVTNGEDDRLSAQATKLAQYADLLCLCDLVMLLWFVKRR
jgi:hypothetical protein